MLVNLFMVLFLLLLIIFIVVVVDVPRQWGALDLFLWGAGSLLGTGAELLTRGEEEVGELRNLTVENFCRHEGQPREWL